MEKNMEKGFSYGRMIALMKVSFMKIIYMVMENIYGGMEEHMKENGKKIKWKEKEFSLGLMEENIKVIMF